MESVKIVSDYDYLRMTESRAFVDAKSVTRIQDTEFVIVKAKGDATLDKSIRSYGFIEGEFVGRVSNSLEEAVSYLHGLKYFGFGKELNLLEVAKRLRQQAEQFEMRYDEEVRSQAPIEVDHNPPRLNKTPIKGLDREQPYLYFRLLRYKFGEHRQMYRKENFQCSIYDKCSLFPRIESYLLSAGHEIQLGDYIELISQNGHKPGQRELHKFTGYGYQRLNNL
jgi:hypothetical protein